MLAPMKYKNPQNFLFTCLLCNIHFNQKGNLSSHMKVHNFVLSDFASVDSSSTFSVRVYE